MERATKAHTQAVKENKEKVDADLVRDLLTLPCHYCGTEPRVPLPGKVDKLDPALPIVEGNAVAICTTCQRAKGKASEKEFLAWIERIHEKSIASKTEPKPEP